MTRTLTHPPLARRSLLELAARIRTDLPIRWRMQFHQAGEGEVAHWEIFALHSDASVRLPKTSWAERAMTLINACVTRTAQEAEVARIAQAVAA